MLLPGGEYMPAKYPLKPGVTLIISGEGEKSGLDGLSEIQRFAVIERMTERAGPI